MENPREVVSRQNQRLEIAEESRSGSSVFRCRGSFSLVSHDRLDKLVEKIRRAENRRVVLDLLAVQHIDSTGLGTLATAFKDMRSAGKELVLVPSSVVQTSLRAVGLDRVFEMVESVETALAPK